MMKAGCIKVGKLSSSSRILAQVGVISQVYD